MAQYKEGRVTVTQNSDVVAGTDTRWMSNADIGDLFLVRGDEIPYRIAAVTSDTSLRLNARYAAPTETNTFYSLTRDFTPNLGLPIIRNGDVDAVPLFAEGLITLDAKLGGGGGGGGGSSSSLSGLSDVNVSGAIPGDTFSVLPNGSYGFVRPYVFTIDFQAAPGDGGRIVKSYTGGVLTYRRIKVDGGSVSENADDLTIVLPPPGEINTLATAGTAQSQSLVVAKQGTVLRTKGLRVTAPLTLIPEGNDLVLGSTVTSGGQTVTYTLAPIGSGTSLVASPSGTELRVKTITFDTNFTVGQPAGAGITVALNRLPITHITTVLWDQITSGQILYRNAAGNVVGMNLPSAGITSLSQDAAPTLSAALRTNGNRIIGQPVSFSGMIARPKNKSYTVCLSAPASMRITSAVTRTASGTVAFRVDVGSAPDVADPDTGIPPSPLQGTSSATIQSVSAATPLDINSGEAIVLTTSFPSVDLDDLSFTISGVTT